VDFGRHLQGPVPLGGDRDGPRAAEEFAGSFAGEGGEFQVPQAADIAADRRVKATPAAKGEATGGEGGEEEADAEADRLLAG